MSRTWYEQGREVACPYCGENQNNIAGEDLEIINVVEQWQCEHDHCRQLFGLRYELSVQFFTSKLGTTE